MRTIRPLDYLLAAVLTAAGVFLMWANTGASATDDGLIHPPSTTSWLIIPAFLLVTVPIVARRSNIAAVSVVTAAATVVHVLAFGWLTRCGVVLPLAFALAYATARFSRGLTTVVSLGAVVALLVVMLLRDSSADLAGAWPIAFPGVALFYGAGWLVQNRVSKRQPQPEPAVEIAA
jgi:hypothetical protein